MLDVGFDRCDCATADALDLSQHAYTRERSEGVRDEAPLDLASRDTASLLNSERRPPLPLDDECTTMPHLVRYNSADVTDDAMSVRQIRHAGGHSVHSAICPLAPRLLHDASADGCNDDLSNGQSRARASPSVHAVIRPPGPHLFQDVSDARCNEDLRIGERRSPANASVHVVFSPGWQLDSHSTEMAPTAESMCNQSKVSSTAGHGVTWRYENDVGVQGSLEGNAHVDKGSTFQPQHIVLPVRRHDATPNSTCQRPSEELNTGGQMPIQQECAHDNHAGGRLTARANSQK